MNQPSYSEKLRVIINNLIACSNRVALAENKNQLRLFLEQCASSNQSLIIFQEFLAFCLKYKRLAAMLNILNENGQLGNLFSLQLEEITKKYILATPQASKLDEQSGKKIRLLLTKRILQDRNVMSLIIAECRNDQSICLKFLRLISEYFKQRKPMGNVTQLVVMCINIIKIKDQISNNLIYQALCILNYIGDSSEQIRKIILTSIIGEVLQIYKLGKIQKESLQIINNYLKYTTQQKQLQKLIESICQVLSSKIKQKNKYLKIQKQIIISKEQSEQIVQFLRVCFNLFHECIDKNRNMIRNKNNLLHDDIDMRDGYEDISATILEFSKQSLLVVNQSVVFDIFQLSGLKMQGLQHLLLSQCLINCASYRLKRPENGKNAKQLQIISYILFWLQNMEIKQKNKIRASLNLQLQNVNRQNSEPPISLFGDFIKKSIQNQFQYQFNKELMRSVCNLVCFLAHVLDQSFNPIKSKQFVINIIKMLLNLNQSCQKEYRQFLVYKILKIITIYGKELIKNNQFLKDVLQRKLLDKVFTYKQFITYLNEQRLLSEQFYEKLQNKLQQGQILEAQSADIQFIFDILVSQNKQKMQGNAMGWEWLAYLNSSGRKIYGRQWNSPCEKQLKNIKDSKMSNYYIEFGQDISKIDSMITRKY